MDILQVKNLSFTYPNNSERTLDNVDFTIKEGSFNLICGESGCGKSTLLKLIKKEISPYGEQTGNIFYLNSDIRELEQRKSACEIGFVGQNPDEQIVTDKVWHEIAFGLENLGENSNTIRIKCGEMANYFGIQNWYHKNVNELSGGQKQILNLASVMVMNPKILLLDEATSQLDPISATDFISTLKKLNDELGITILLVEHRLEDAFKFVDNVIAMERGHIIFNGEPRKACEKLRGHKIFLGFPTSARIWGELENKGKCPITVKEGKNFLLENYNNKKGNRVEVTKSTDKNIVIKAKNIFFRYNKNSNDIINDLNLSLYKAEIFSILGGNGSGKTTTINIISGLDKPYKGSITINGKKISKYKNNSLYLNNLAVLPQNPTTLFVKNTVLEDLKEIISSYKKYDDIHIQKIVEELNIKHLLNKHPYDLSGGEQQKCAIAKVLLTKPKILLLDEPTKGLDAYYKNNLISLILKLKENGISILMVTHDIEFAAIVSDRCALFFDGKIVSENNPNEFFSNNNFYTTSASRISRDLFENAILCDEVVRLCKGE